MEPIKHTAAEEEHHTKENPAVEIMQEEEQHAVVHEANEAVSRLRDRSEHEQKDQNDVEENIGFADGNKQQGEGMALVVDSNGNIEEFAHEGTVIRESATVPRTEDDPIEHYRVQEKVDEPAVEEPKDEEPAQEEAVEEAPKDPEVVEAPDTESEKAKEAPVAEEPNAEETDAEAQRKIDDPAAEPEALKDREEEHEQPAGHKLNEEKYNKLLLRAARNSNG